ncbi:MAG: hypothetical protein QOJ39_82 [Candidatus Eremiobacteraeota bacterium]|jgi:hypothetical protein|nr:hypothetical protein [Candidatus Eremiobacteraeota bacterium]
MRPRFHARFPGALCENLDALGPNARLAAYRIEPVRTVDGPRHYVDLTFSGGDDVAVVAGIALDLVALAHRDRSPFVAPREALVVADRLGDACDALRAALASAFAQCAELPETLHVIPGIAEALVAARRTAGALGAAPYASVARARGRSVADGAYVETCFGGEVPMTLAVAGATFGDPDAPLRCYVPLSDDALSAGGAAYRAALAVGEALGGEDLAVDIAGYDGRSLDAYAFVHAVGLDDPHAAAELIAAARARGIRTLLTPLCDDETNGGFWGARTHARALAMSDDEEMLAALLGFIVKRNVELDAGVLPNEPWEPRPGYRDAQRSALALADVVFVTCAAEAQRIRALCGADRPFAAYVPVAHEIAVPDQSAHQAALHGLGVPDPALRDTAAPVPATPYLLAVAPVGPLHASATLARAASRVGFPVRFIGNVLDGAYAARALSYLDERSSLAQGNAGDGARVVVDVSWSGADLSSLAAYAAHGIPVVASDRSDARDVLGARSVWSVDPADETAIAAALADAWNAAGAQANALAEHVRPRCRIDVLRACLANAYLPAETVA